MENQRQELEAALQQLKRAREESRGWWFVSLGVTFFMFLLVLHVRRSKDEELFRARSEARSTQLELAVARGEMGQLRERHQAVQLRLRTLMESETAVPVCRVRLQACERRVGLGNVLVVTTAASEGATTMSAYECHQSVQSAVLASQHLLQLFIRCEQNVSACGGDVQRYRDELQASMILLQRCSSFLPFQPSPAH